MRVTSRRRLLHIYFSGVAAVPTVELHLREANARLRHGETLIGVTRLGVGISAD